MIEQLAVFGIDVQDAGEEIDLGGVAASGTEAWYDGTGGAIVGSDQDDFALLARSAVGHGAASGDAGGQVVSPARGLYTLPGHPCLAQYPVLDPSTTPASPVPTVPSVSTTSTTSSIPTTQTTPDPANDQDTNPQTAPVPAVSTVPSVPITPADPDPANDQDTGSKATPVPNVPNVTSTPPTPTARQARLTTPDETAGAWESDPDQQPDNPQTST